MVGLPETIYGADAHVSFYNEILMGAVTEVACLDGSGEVPATPDVMLVVGGSLANVEDPDAHHPVL